MKKMRAKARARKSKGAVWRGGGGGRIFSVMDGRELGFAILFFFIFHFSLFIFIFSFSNGGCGLGFQRYFGGFLFDYLM